MDTTDVSSSEYVNTEVECKIFAVIPRLRRNDPMLTALDTHPFLGGISISVVKQLADALEKNNTLTTLDLSCTNLGNDGAKHIAEALQANSTLTTLIMRYNGIDSEGAEYIAMALQANNTLTTLDLSSNDLGAEGAKHIANK